ncbi:MAG: mechanosensitive ion channel protein MscS [Pseudonocardiales bacterium]|nr:MAG: mechanosensitive ion channel protein MscS [Pseudonocardiales bacterium]
MRYQGGVTPTLQTGAHALLAAKPSCVSEPGTLCEFVYRVTKQGWLASSADWLIAKPLQILFIAVGAFVIRFLAHRVINRFITTTSESKVPNVLRPLRDRAAEHLDVGPLTSERRRQRAATIGSVLRSIASAVIGVIAFMLMLGEVGINLAPLIASAGIVGVAVGFGAQNLVKDFLSGMFMILEDQYGVGDVIDVGEATGTVEAVGLRTTRLRDDVGVVWYVRNGEILRVGNKSQGWSRAIIDVPVAYTADLRRAREVLKEVADEVWHDPEYADLIIEEPAVTGVETMSREGVALRLMVKTKPEQQAPVARELRGRIKERFDSERIDLPYPPGTMLIAGGTPTPAPPLEVPPSEK